LASNSALVRLERVAGKRFTCQRVGWAFMDKSQMQFSRSGRDRQGLIEALLKTDSGVKPMDTRAFRNSSGMKITIAPRRLAGIG
jgi:hypothetical protein